MEVFDMYEWVHERERVGFDFEVWNELYRKAVSHRQSTWDSDAKDGNRVRVNDIPLIKDLPNFKNYDGKFFKDNWIFKHIKWLVSMLSGSIVTYDCQSKTTFRDENTELLECELNLVSCLLDIPKQTSAALYDCFYTGMGYVRRHWDKYAVSIANETGVPVLKHVSSMKMYIDPTTQANDKSDMGYIFHVERYNWKEMAKRYPKHKQEFDAKQDSDHMVSIVTLQYKVEELIESVWISDEAQQPVKKWILPLKEYEEKCGRGELLPEQCIVSKKFKNRKVFWYEAKFFADIDCVVQEPEFIGERCSYHIMHYSHNAESAYSKGLVYYMISLQEISIIMLTTLSVQMLNMVKPAKIIEPGSIEDFEGYMQNGAQLGVPIVPDVGWRALNPDKDPIKYLPLPEFPHGITIVEKYLKESAESMSGVTPTMQGEPVYSQMSGVAAAQFMSAGKIYHKEEQIKYQQYLNAIGYGLMFDIAENRDFSHYVEHLGEDNQMEQVLVNDLENSPFVFEPERTLVFAEIVENIELLKQIQREQAMNLRAAGLLSGVDTIDYSGLDNPQRLYDRAMQEQGMLEVNKFLASNPEVMSQLEEMMSQAVGSN